MALSDPTATITTDMSGVTSDSNLQGRQNLEQFTIASKSTDTNDYTPDFNKWHGTYRDVPEARSTIDVWCKWIVNKELIMNSSTRKLTSRIRGNGIDTIRTILINHKRTSKICGDSFIEIIRDRAKRVINLKLLDPSSIKIRPNDKGIIKLYIQSKSKIVNGVKETKTITFQPEDIWHLANDRIADEIHGRSELEKLDKIVKWRQQAMMDMSIVFHRYVKPLLQIKAETDDPVELAALAKQYDNAFKNFENIIIPKGVVDEVERALKDALGDIAASLKEGKIVAGAGSPEIELSKGLREFANTLSGREQFAVLAFAESMEIIPRTLAENAGLDPIDVLTELKSEHDKGNQNHGIDVFSGKVMDAWKRGVIEPLKIKTQAISSAAEVAVMILRIDDVIASSGSKDKAPEMPPGGMPPGMGGMGM